MVMHYIILGSSYSYGKRIALDYTGIDIENFKSDLKKIFDECGDDVSVSWHYLTTESYKWKSVSAKDKFFKDVMLVDGLEKFIELLKKDRVLSGFDVAKYILSKVSCTHLKLQKLTYLCYADYLCNTNKKLFDDKIYAFKYGPVVESVYEECKRKYGDLSSINDKSINSNKIFEMPSKSRILVAESGFEKCVSIDNTLTKYGDLSASELVEITHVKDSPWDRTYKNEMYDVILDETILKYHENEVVG